MDFKHLHHVVHNLSAKLTAALFCKYGKRIKTALLDSKYVTVSQTLWCGISQPKSFMLNNCGNVCLWSSLTVLLFCGTETEADETSNHRTWHKVFLFCCFLFYVVGPFEYELQKKRSDLQLLCWLGWFWRGMKGQRCECANTGTFRM